MSLNLAINLSSAGLAPLVAIPAIYGEWNTTPSQGVPTFSDNNHTVTGQLPNASTRVFVNRSHGNSGKWYFEFTAGKTMSSNDNIAFGDNALTNWVALWSTGFQANFTAFGSLASGSCPKAGDHCAIAFDLDNKLIWFVNFTSGTNPGHWNDDGSGSPPASNPATGTGGASWDGKASIPSGQVYISLYTNTGFEMTINLGDSAFVGAVPAGFTPWISAKDT